jgi:hypothetical protein
MADGQKQLVRLSGLSRRLGLSIRWLKQEADARRIPCLSAEGVLLFDPDAVERVLVERAGRGVHR